MSSAISVVVTAGRGGRALLITAQSIGSQRAYADVALVTTAGSDNPPLLDSVATRLGARVVASNRGPGAGLNQAVRSCAGELLAIVPAGFVLPSAFLERCVMAFRTAAEVEALAPAVEVQTSDGLGRAVWLPAGLDAAAVLADPASVPPVLVMRRSTVEALGGFDEELPALVEFEFWLRLTLSGRRIAPLLEPLVVRELGV